MALFTDGTPSDLEYLRSYESAILDIAESEGIDLEAKLRLAASEVGDALLRFLMDRGTREAQFRRRLYGLGDVVVTPALRRWHALRTLELAYRDAYGNQLNERYGTKLREYAEVAQRAGEECLQVGIGLVWDPVPKAGIPSVKTGADAQSAYFAQVTWVNAAGAEGAAGDIALLNVADGAEISAGDQPAGATGWNIYLGVTRDSLHRQNAEPIRVSDVWIFAGPATVGKMPGAGQQADYVVLDYQGVLRG